MPWTGYTTTHFKIAAITGFRSHALQHIPVAMHAGNSPVYNAAVASVAQAMQNGAVGCTGLIFAPSQADVFQYIQTHLNRRAAIPGNVPLPSAAGLMANPDAVLTAKRALLSLAFEDNHGNHTQYYP